ncbi:S8 family peptidase [Tellurirhabdus bombi]|uniref:S8 family peptidase n=1 Tax=Tellurirhabdus bombi TaxID=2907205 RepID=UPI001F33BEE8|nr:S8 family peptidase [Tellurirhabdus bombi]
MNNFSLKNALWAAALPALLTACQPAENVQTEASNLVQFRGKNASARAGATQKYIVSFKSDADMARYLPEDNSDYEARSQRMRTLISRLIGVDIAAKSDEVYTTALKGFSAELSDYDLQVLQKFSLIESIEPDQEVSLVVPNQVSSMAVGQAQVVPWGITRVGGPRTYTGSKKVWIIDTGVLLTHPDLNVNTSLSKGFIGNSSGNDGNGHGTHVAGTIGARNNTIGVVGVAPGVQVVAVKVLSDAGSGSNATVIAGIDYVAATAASGDVANMSLGGGVSTTLDNAVKNAANRGIKFAVAAGNERSRATTSSPARVDHANVVTVSAHDINNRFASFSNYGNPPIDWCAPGVNIESTWLGNNYNTISGTSMATPHVAGILLFGTPLSRGTVTGDRDTTPDKLAKLP